MSESRSHRLYVKGEGILESDGETGYWNKIAKNLRYRRHVSYKRAMRNTYPNTSLIQIENVATKEEANFYLGKRIAYVYRGSKDIRGTKIRVIWGKITRTHGNSGIVRAQFRNNLPARTFGASVRIMLYPSNL